MVTVQNNSRLWGTELNGMLGLWANERFQLTGLAGFRYIDLDTPMLLASDPFTGGYEQFGMTYRLNDLRAGLGVTQVAS